MDWKASSFDWNRARALLVTAEEGSFSAAARALGLTQSTLGRQVNALEEDLNVTLFERVGHRLVLTQTGLELVEQVRSMNEAATRLSLIAAGQSQKVEGLVRIAASEAVAGYILPKMVAEMRASHPGIQIELVVSNQSSDLRRREADIAIRHARPRGDDLLARLICDNNRAFLYGSPDYLAKIGRPKSAADLVKKADVLGFDDSDSMRSGLALVGLPFDAEKFPVRTENHLVQWELAKRGVGLCMMMEEVGDQDPQVVRALPHDDPGIGYPTWLVSHRELRTSRRVRIIYDLLVELLTSTLGKRPSVTRRE